MSTLREHQSHAGKGNKDKPKSPEHRAKLRIAALKASKAAAAARARRRAEKQEDTP